MVRYQHVNTSSVPLCRRFSSSLCCYSFFGVAAGLHFRNYTMAAILQVTEAGGMTKYIDSGAAKLRIEEAATKKQV